MEKKTRKKVGCSDSRAVYYYLFMYTVGNKLSKLVGTGGFR